MQLWRWVESAVSNRFAHTTCRATRTAARIYTKLFEPIKIRTTIEFASRVKLHWWNYELHNEEVAH
eukprot:3513723-Prymnesium_polylepis.1